MKPLIILLTLLLTTKLNSQVVAGGSIGYAKKLIVGANVGYDINHWQGCFDLRLYTVKNGTWFGLTGGYLLPISEQVSIKPYIGYWLRRTGIKNPSDRYVINSNEQILSTTNKRDRNGGNFGGGIQVSYELFTFGLSKVGDFQISVGMTGFISNW